jgi:hypothetical protein
MFGSTIESTASVSWAGHRHLKPCAIREKVGAADRLVYRQQPGWRRLVAGVSAKRQRFFLRNAGCGEDCSNCNQHSTYSNDLGHAGSVLRTGIKKMALVRLVPYF